MVSKPWKAQIAPLPAENTCIPIVITAVYSPVKFWAQLLVTANTGVLYTIFTDTVTCEYVCV